MHIDGTFDRSRARRRSLCVFVLLERGRDGGWWSWVVFECPCVSVVSESFLMNKQHTRYTQSTPSHSLYACRAPCIASFQRTLREANNAQTTEPEVVGTSFLACEPPRRRGARWACSAHSPFTWPAPARPAPHWSTPSDRARGGCAIWNHGHETSQRTFCPYLAVSCTQHHNHL